jgi:hypothetical protein
VDDLSLCPPVPVRLDGGPSAIAFSGPQELRMLGLATDAEEAESRTRTLVVAMATVVTWSVRLAGVRTMAASWSG